MKKYKVIFTETQSFVVEVEADSYDSAEEIATNNYQNGEYDGNERDFVEVPDIEDYRDYE